MHDLEFGFTPGVHAALVCILYLMTCFLLAPMTRYSTCSHALCSLPFWALSCYNTGKIPYLLKSACKAAKLHGNILPDSRTLQRCGVFFFWRRLFSVTEPKFQSLLTLSSNNSPLETPTPKKYDIFGKLRTWAFSWWYPGFGYQYQKLE